MTRGKRISVKSVQHVGWSATFPTHQCHQRLLANNSIIHQLVVAAAVMITILKVTTTVMVTTVALIITNCKTMIWLVCSLHVLIISCAWSSTIVIIYQGVPDDRCISFRCIVLWSSSRWLVHFRLCQDSGIESLNISQILCSTQQAVTTCGILIIFMSFLFVSLLHLALSRPNAFSTMIRDLGKV